MPDLMIILKLFTSFLVTGLFSFGGGYSSLSIMEDMMVNKYLFLSKAEFWQVVAIAQVTPGPIALNCATYIGAKIAGILGAVVSTLSVIFMPILLSIFLIYIYKISSKNDIIRDIFQNLQKMIPFLIILSLFSLSLDVISDFYSILILALSFLFIFLFPKISILIKIISCGAVSLLLFSIVK
jgi:chromate transporter